MFVPFNWYWAASVEIYQQIDSCRSCNNSSAYSLQFTIYSTLMRVSEVCLNNKSLRLSFWKGELSSPYLYVYNKFSILTPILFCPFLHERKHTERVLECIDLAMVIHGWNSFDIFSHVTKYFLPFFFLSLCSHYRKISLDTINESRLFINEHPVESNFLLDKF